MSHVQVDVEKGLPEEAQPSEAPKNVVGQGGDDGGSCVSKGPLTFLEVKERRERYGMNCLASEKKNAWYMTLLQAFFHPFNILLCIIATFSAVADEFSTAIIISVMVLISTSLRFYQEWMSEGAVHGLLKLITKSVSVIRFDTVEPMAMEMTVPSEELVPGDWVVLRPGELVPADSVILTSKVFYVSQAPLTGEALPVEKHRLAENPQESEEVKEFRRKSDALKVRRISEHKPMPKTNRFFRTIFGMKISTDAQLDHSGYELREDLSSEDHVFMGTQVITGMATVRVIRTGPDTLFGRMAEALSKSQPTNPFQQGVKRISWIFFFMMALMVPPVCIIQAVWGRSSNEDNWRRAFIFSLSVAVGLTPEMLPMIVNGNLAKGSTEMSRKSSIVKKLDAIINLGAVDILCTDKTGTLTKSVVQLNMHLDPYGIPSFIPLQISYLNAYFQSILQNPLDTAITTYCDGLGQKPSRDSILERISETRLLESKSSVFMNPEAFVHRFSRVDEIPFDFVRRRLSLILKENRGGKDAVYLVCKGAVEEMLSVCTKVVNEGAKTRSSDEVFPSEEDIIPLTAKLVAKFIVEHTQFTERGERVLAVAFKSLPPTTTTGSAEDESNMTFVGFLSFTDPPKDSAKKAIVELIKHHIEIKVLTGDSANICSSVCSDIELPVKQVVTGDELMEAEKKGNEWVWQLVKKGTIFAKLTPLQKLLVVQTLKKNNHVVAFMGDGINDAPALREADVGISVENGVDICREAAHVIFLDKDLGVVVDGIRIGRKTYGNTLKYIAMAVSSNFGNVFSVLVATLWLPYEPMSSLHLLTQNLLYDFSQIAIPWDHMDEEFLEYPHKWKIKSILRFMLWMGPWSSVFDILTFVFMYFYFDIKDENDTKKVTLFQTAWFTVGLLTQTLIVHMIRTTKIPLIQSRASLALTCATLTVMGIGLALPYIPKINEHLKFKDAAPLPIEFYGFLGAVLASYCVASQVAKYIYIKIFKEWF